LHVGNHVLLKGSGGLIHIRKIHVQLVINELIILLIHFVINVNILKFVFCVKRI